MENTLSLLLQDTSPEWYCVINSKPQGPLSAKDIVTRVQAGELSFASHLWKEGEASWQRIYEIEKFHPLMPAEPSTAVIQEIMFQKKKAVVPPAPPKPAEEVREWYVFVDDTQYGPFSSTELVGLIQGGRVVAQSYIWKKGFTDWELAENVKEWKSHFHKPKIPATKPVVNKDKRSAPRKPFEARVILTDGKEVGWALCRDISVGGMQILMDHAPGPVGTSLKLNISTANAVPSFACEGVVVRILDDGRGFSFRFTTLPGDARQAIEKYIAQ
jgi:hypothetical protein